MLLIEKNSKMNWGWGYLLAYVVIRELSLLLWPMKMNSNVFLLGITNL